MSDLEVPLKTSLPFNILNDSSINRKALTILGRTDNKYVNTVTIKLERSDLQGGWHIQGYQINDRKYVDLTRAIFEDWGF